MNTQPVRLRSGDPGDGTWLYQLFRDTMRDQIDEAWGWDELFQREGFVTTLPATGFWIIEVDGRAEGAYFLKRKDDSVTLILEMILVEPTRQRAGLGSRMMQSIKEEALGAQRAIELRVLKTNPAREFYRAMGFVDVATDRHSVTMKWIPNTLLA